MLKLDDIEHLENIDYQNRIESRKYPESNIPDNIEVYEESGELFVRAFFKNTQEVVAYEWLKNYLNNNKLEYKIIDVSQDGEYHNDWVLASANLKR